MDYLYHLITFIALYTILASSLNLFSGYTGLLSLSHAGFYGIGAYTSALLSVNFATPIVLNFILAILLSGGLAYLIALIALRTYEDYFVIITLGVQVVIYALMNNLMSITGGPLGVVGIPSINYFDTNLSFMFLSLFVMTSIYYLLYRFDKSAYALNLKGIRGDEVLMQSLGKNVKNIKIKTFVISASIAAIAGVLYAHYISYIDPSSFTIHESIFILSIVIIGGLGKLRGSLFAATLMVLLPEILRFVGFPDSIAANMRQIIYGILLVGIIIWQGGLTALNNKIFKALGDG
ncbi:MAG: branched-chain amino acid ABC transporter permease [Urechidicola sp.]|nr:branched-chain amino acid ABC transporter permease [Urechidicola sp.]